MDAKEFKTINIQNEMMKIHHQYGTSETANYKIQLFCEEYAEAYHQHKLNSVEKKTKGQCSNCSSSNIAWTLCLDCGHEHLIRD